MYLRFLSLMRRALTIAGVAAPSMSAQECPPGAPVAIVDAAVLTMQSDTLLARATVVVRDGRIAAIDPPSLPPDACRVDAQGRVLLPGLADMHAHTDETEMPLFLANGVTLVREMNGSPTHLALRDRLARGELAGPRLLVASPLLVGDALRYRHLLLESDEDAYQVAHELSDAGYDYLKIYDGLKRPVYAALVRAGTTLGLPLDGHVPEDVGLERVLEAGQAIQHMDKIAMALGGPRAGDAALTRARQLFSARRAWVTPTLASLYVLDHARTRQYAEWLQRPEMVYVDSGALQWWRSLSGDRTRSGASPFYRMQTALLPVLRDAGTRFLLGTDAANPLMVAGFSVHDEMEALVRDGGFSPIEVLAMATRNVGDFLHEPLVGRIAAGAPADLVLVDRNPLEDLTTLRTPRGVMANGRWYARAQLDTMLAAAKRR
jgi:hypothetical protein